MKETRADYAVGFHKNRDPRRVANGRDRLDTTEMRAEMPDDLPKFLRRFGDESATLAVRYDCLDFRLERREILCREPRGRLRRIRPVKCGRRQIDCQKRDPIQCEIPRRRDGCAKVREIEPLYGAAGGNRIIGLLRPDRPHSAREFVECPGNAADAIVNLARPIERKDHIVDVRHDGLRVSFEQQARCSEW